MNISRGTFPRLAVIGCGDVAGERHLPALAVLGWRPHVPVDPCRERACALARRYKVKRVARDISELAPGEVWDRLRDRVLDIRSPSQAVSFMKWAAGRSWRKATGS